MAEQSFANHVYRPTLTVVGGILTLLAGVLFAGAWLFGWGTLFGAGLMLCLAVLVMGAALRTSVTRLQDRIILLEMKVRCAELLPAGQDALLNELSTKQVVALRFASDRELGALLERSVREKLAPVDIKRAVQAWRPDGLRA